MPNSLTAQPRQPAPELPQMLAIGFIYWLAFLLALEPGNVARALRAGADLRWSREIVRILGASLLGCAATPILLELVRRFPVEGRQWRRRVVQQGLGGLALAAGLIFVSCVLADGFLVGPRRPFGPMLSWEMMANGPPVAFCIGGFIALAHAVRLFKQGATDTSGPRGSAPGYLASISVRERGSVTLVDVDSIDWVETQGNYLALHVGAETHLIRESLGRLAARLDPVRFRRVHRRTLVAANRIARVVSLGAGDARLTLRDGTQLRLSRTYREAIAATLAPDRRGGRGADPSAPASVPTASRPS